MKFFLGLVWFGSAMLAFANESYPDSEAAKHVGETVEVHGKVSDVHVTNSGMVLLNFGGKYPAQTFTAVIFTDHAAQFPNTDKYQGATLSVTGEIKLHKDKPELVLDSPDQVKVLAATEPKSVPPPASSAALGAKTVVGPDGVTRTILPFTPGSATGP